MYLYEDRVRAVKLYIKLGNASRRPSVSWATRRRTRSRTRGMHPKQFDQADAEGPAKLFNPPGATASLVSRPRLFRRRHELTKAFVNRAAAVMS